VQTQHHDLLMQGWKQKGWQQKGEGSILPEIS